jgi:hypothetical protein
MTEDEKKPQEGEVKEDELEDVSGGALNAYMKLTGETQGTTKSPSAESPPPKQES